MQAEAKLFYAAECQLGEGPIWEAATGTLYWVDILGESVFALRRGESLAQVYAVGAHVGAVAPAPGETLMMATRHGFSTLDLKTGAVGDPLRPAGFTHRVRFNDGKCDPRGRFFAGTMAYNAAPGAGKVYVIEKNLAAQIVLEGVTISNGLAWDRAKNLFYYVDTPTRRVDAFDYEPATGALSNRRTAFTIPHDAGFPDGMTIDAEGKLWVAHWDGWHVRRYDPETGECLISVKVPAARVTSCCFGGPELKTLFITTARGGMKDDALTDQPRAGSLFTYESEVPGVAEARFGEAAVGEPAKAATKAASKSSGVTKRARKKRATKKSAKKRPPEGN